MQQCRNELSGQNQIYRRSEEEFKQIYSKEEYLCRDADRAHRFAESELKREKSACGDRNVALLTCRGEVGELRSSLAETQAAIVSNPLTPLGHGNGLCFSRQQVTDTINKLADDCSKEC